MVWLIIGGVVILIIGGYGGYKIGRSDTIRDLGRMHERELEEKLRNYRRTRNRPNQNRSKKK